MKIEKRGKTKIVREGLAIYSIISDDIKVGGYWDYFIPIYNLYKDPKVLVIGVAGGTMFRQMEKLGIKNYIGVDINKEVLKFWNKGVVIDDGLNYVKRTKRKFDIIIVDAFNGLIMPYKFFTKEFIQNAYKKLNLNGMLCYNYLVSIRNLILLPIFLHNMKTSGFHTKIDFHPTNWVIEGRK